MFDFSQSEKESIQKSRLLGGLNPEQLENALCFFGAQLKSYKRGQLIHSSGSALTAFGLMLCGSVQVYAVDISGNRIIMANVLPGETFGEAMCFLKSEELPANILATSDVRILMMHTDKMNSAAGFDSPADRLWTQRFISALAVRMLQMNGRIQVLSKETLRSKLLTLFSQCVHGYSASSFTLPMNREDMAAYLGVNRTALSRELSKMRDEGLIAFHKNHFVLLDKIISAE